VPAVRAARGVKKDNIHLDASNSELVITGEINEREHNGALRRRDPTHGAVRVPRDAPRRR